MLKMTLVEPGKELYGMNEVRTISLTLQKQLTGGNYAGKY